MHEREAQEQIECLSSMPEALCSIPNMAYIILVATYLQQKENHKSKLSFDNILSLNLA